MEDASINQLLSNAALQGDHVALQALLQRDSLLIYRSSTNTSLHVACKHGHVQFVQELLHLNPSLSEELDPNDKSSPLHIASRNGHLELVTFLVSINRSMCFTRDVHGMNPVHVAAVKGHLHVLDMLLRTVPAVARERVLLAGGVGESLLHLCVKYGLPEAVKKVVSAVGDEELLNATDVDGNTVLHVAVANKQVEIVRFLVNDARVKRNTPNLKGLTPKDIFEQSYKDVNNDYLLKLAFKQFKMLQSEEIKKEKNQHLDWLENQRSVLMVVASLIATMAFQASISPPGGVWQDTTLSTDGQPGHVASSPIMAQHDKYKYNIFIVLITIGLLSSMSSILLLISGLPCRRIFLVLIMVTMWVAITSMTVVYGVSLVTFTPKEDVNVMVDIIFYSLFVWLGVMGMVLLGHVIWWMVRFIRLFGILVKKLFKYFFPNRQI